MEGAQKFKKFSKNKLFFQKNIFSKIIFFAKIFFKNRAISKNIFRKNFFKKRAKIIFLKTCKNHFFKKFSNRSENIFLKLFLSSRASIGSTPYVLCTIAQSASQFSILKKPQKPAWSRRCVPAWRTRGVCGACAQRAHAQNPHAPI